MSRFFGETAYCGFKIFLWCQIYIYIYISHIDFHKKSLQPVLLFMAGQKVTLIQKKLNLNKN